MARPATGADNAQTRLGRYELLARVASGGMGEIFLARLEGAEGFEKLYVVKRILAHLADDVRFRQMLVAEARIASKMSHPNICQVFELGESDGQLYIVMEYLEGISLLSMLRWFSKQRSPLELGLIAGVFGQVADAMNYAHELKDRDGGYLGIIHRDVTPSNIFITETGVAKVLDFGIAKARGASTQTQEGTVKGKYAYMAPEQLRGAPIDRRVDIFAMGIVLYEMLALRRLFQRKTDYLTFRAVVEEPLPDIRKYRPELPDGVAVALHRALDRDVDHRFERARDFGRAVLEGMIGYRPWSQGEIGDFLRHNFAAEIDQRGKQVQGVVAGARRATMPLLVSPDEGQHEDDEDDLFPSVETEVEAAPATARTPSAPLLAGHGAELAASTGGGMPPPFGSGPSGPEPARAQPSLAGTAVGGTPTSSVVVAHKRSLVWPLLAAAMVAIAAGALFLVWQQTQNQQAPAEIKITQESAIDRGPPSTNAQPERMHVMTETGSDASAPPPDDTRATEPSKPPAQAAVQPKQRRPKDYNSAIAEKKSDLVRCLAEHRDGIPPSEILAAINIAASGKAKTVHFTPASLDAAPLGGCLRTVLMRANYPSAATDQLIRLPLKPKT